MRARRWWGMGGFALLLMGGCGGGRMHSGTQTGEVPAGGNWAFVSAATTGSAALQIPFVSGSLMTSGNQVSADLLPLLLADTSCTLPASLGVTLSGAVQDSKITLTSTPWDGGVITVKGTVSADGTSFSGPWSIKGGCADGQSGTLVGMYVPPVTGTWTGTASTTPGGTTNPLTGSTATFVFQQSKTPNQFSFPLAGSVSVAGSGCGFSNGTLVETAGPDGLPISTITGTTWVAVAPMDDGKSTAIAVGARDPLNTGMWTVLLGITGGSCDGALVQVAVTQS